MFVKITDDILSPKYRITGLFDGQRTEDSESIGRLAAFCLSMVTWTTSYRTFSKLNMFNQLDVSDICEITSV